MKMKNEKKLISKMGSSVCLFQVQKKAQIFDVYYLKKETLRFRSVFFFENFQI